MNPRCSGMCLVSGRACGSGRWLAIQRANLLEGDRGERGGRHDPRFHVLEQGPYRRQEFFPIRMRGAGLAPTRAILQTLVGPEVDHLVERTDLGHEIADEA